MSVLLLLGGCSTSASIEPAPTTGSPPASSVASAQTQAPSPSTPRVADPRDARDYRPCDLLSPAQLSRIGLNASSGEEQNAAPARACSWNRTDDAGDAAGVQARTDLTVTMLEGLAATKDTFARFEPMDISGHPAIRADRTSATGCTLYTAVADYQGIATNGGFAGRDPDPCARSRRMAEMILSNLPPLR
jgi:hypothetical protein